MATAQPAPDLFPKALAEVSLSEQVSESFAGAPGAFGLLAIGTLISLLVGPDVFGWRKDLSGAAILAATGVGGGLLLWWELRRRARRTVLVQRGGWLALYLNSQLTFVVNPADVQRWQFRPGKTVMVGLSAVSVLVFGLIMPLFDSSMRADQADYWGMNLFFSVLVITFGSGFYSRVALAHYIIPTTGRMGGESVKLKKAAAPRVFNF